MLAMRWDNLFDDLEGQLEAEIGAVEREVHDDLERHRQAHLTLHDRLVNLLSSASVHAEGAVAADDEPDSEPDNGHHDSDVLALTLASGQSLSVVLIRLGQDWCAVDVISPPAFSGHAIVPIAAIAAVNLAPHQVTRSLRQAPEVRQAPRIADLIGLGFVLRDIARRRHALEIHTLRGIFGGTLDRVGSDHCDLAEHSPRGARRNENVRTYRVVSLADITLVRIF